MAMTFLGFVSASGRWEERKVEEGESGREGRGDGEQVLNDISYLRWVECRDDVHRISKVEDSHAPPPLP